MDTLRYNSTEQGVSNLSCSLPSTVHLCSAGARLQEWLENPWYFRMLTTSWNSFYRYTPCTITPPSPTACMIFSTIITTAEALLATSSVRGKVEFTHSRWYEIMNRTSSPPCFVPVYMRQSQSWPVQTDSPQSVINDALRQWNKWLSGFEPIRSLPLRTQLESC